MGIVARTIAGFSEAYGPGRSKTYELIKEGKLETRKHGGRVLITEESARRWFASLPTGRERTAASAPTEA